jgi:hypothetical protein
MEILLTGSAVCLGLLVLAVGVALALLTVIGALEPNPRSGLTPPPLDRPGHRYTCHCWQSPVSVVIADQRRRSGRRRRARTR